MKILIVGSGGREHTLAWKLAQLDRIEQLFVAPGNGGTAGFTNIALSKVDELIEFALEQAIDLTIVGPEAPLAEGMVDAFQAKGLKIFGPTQAAARIESSKAFSKAFMERHNIPTAKHQTFTDFEQARSYLVERFEDAPVVIKASGLAAGKGVLLPDTLSEAETALRTIMLDKKFGAAGDKVIIEERLEGPEVSVLAFSDGETVIPMPPAQDHKRAYNNDEGPNTGGMGAYAPAPICPPEMINEAVKTILQPVVDGMKAEGYPYVGILYGGLILTADGLKTLEYNCRFGDPEAQVILPLLESDLLDVIEHCVNGTLSQASIAWKAGSAATVVMASGGYPEHYETGKLINGLSEAGEMDNVIVFHAGTKAEDGQIFTAGGRVLNVTGLGADLSQALAKAYEAVKLISFEAAHYRTDIGAKAAKDI